MPSPEDMERAGIMPNPDGQEDVRPVTTQNEPGDAADDFQRWPAGTNTPGQAPNSKPSATASAGPEEVEALTSFSSMKQININIVECNGGGFLVIEGSTISAHTSLAQALEFIGRKTTEVFNQPGGVQGNYLYNVPEQKFQSGAVRELPKVARLGYESFVGRGEPAIYQAYDEVKATVKRFPAAFMAGLGVAVGLGIGFLAVNHFA